MIRQWKPWEKSTGPKTSEGKSIVARNAYKGGEWLELRKLSCALKKQRSQLERLNDRL